MPAFPVLPFLRTAISSRAHGSMRASATADATSVASLDQRRAAFLSENALPPSLVTATQVHGTRVGVVRDVSDIASLDQCDALVTSVPNLSLGVFVADCLPVFFVDPVARCIGVAHAGWRGLAGGVLEETVCALVASCDATASRLSAYIGPHIRACHFSVAPDVAVRFPGHTVVSPSGTISVDLASAARERLRRLGLRDDAITEDPRCTFCEAATLFSFRYDKIRPPLVQIAVIGMREEICF